jgi:hypothetical protein
MNKLNLKFEANRWSEWWLSQTPRAKLTPLLLGLAYILLNFLFHILRTDHVGIALITLTLYYLGPRVRPFFKFILPLILVGVVYDSQRIYADYIRGPIHVREPYDFDHYFFGINTPEGRLTPNEWWQKHTYALLDLYCGFFYLCFISIYVSICAYFCFWLPKKGTAKHPASWFQDQAFRPMWAFFFVNCLGYSTYYWFAAAPPWYVAQYGLLVSIWRSENFRNRILLLDVFLCGLPESPLHSRYFMGINLRDPHLCLTRLLS